MKYSIYNIFVFILFLTANSFSNELEDFNRANAEYKSGNFQKAIQIYENLIKTGIEDENVFFNLGNSYFRINKLGLATLYFEKAKKLNSNNEDINHNLKLCRAKQINKIDNIETFPLYNLTKYFIDLLTIDQLTFLLLFSFILLLSFIILFLVFRGQRYFKLIFFSMLIIFSIFVLSLFLTVYRIIDYNNSNEAIIITEQVIVKSAPDESSRDSFIINEGLKVYVLDTIDNWTRIKLLDGKVGWIKKDYIAII